MVETSADIRDPAGRKHGPEQLQHLGGGAGHAEREDVLPALERMVFWHTRHVGRVIEQPVAF